MGCAIIPNICLFFPMAAYLMVCSSTYHVKIKTLDKENPISVMGLGAFKNHKTWQTHLSYHTTRFVAVLPLFPNVGTEWLEPVRDSHHVIATQTIMGWGREWSWSNSPYFEKFLGGIWLSHWLPLHAEIFHTMNPQRRWA